jgi:hypothetical protein
MTKTYSYLGQVFEQRESGKRMILFLAPAEHIVTWGGVPQKSSNFMRGFQRAQISKHWRDIAKYFDDENNMSPTAVVVAFKPGSVKVKPIKLSEIEFEDESKIAFSETTSKEVSGLQHAIIEFELEDFESFQTLDLVRRVRDQFTAFVPPTTGTEKDEEDSEKADEEIDDASDDEENGGELSIQSSHLGEFMDFLDNGYKEAIVEDEDRLRKLLSNLLRPATIVDGQHRSQGAAFREEGIPFPVVGLIEGDWREQVFQFVVINKKAEPITAEFLSAIVSSSLSDEDIKALKTRLEQAGINLDETKIMDRVQLDGNSPFRGMIDFKVEGGQGTLKYSGMLGLARNFKNLRTHLSRNEPGYLASKQLYKNVFDGLSSESKLAERWAAWNNERWFGCFFSFWTSIQDELCTKPGYDELWTPGSNLLKVVTLQEMQKLFMAWLAQSGTEVKSISDIPELAAKWLGKLKPKFFDKDWQITSLQSAPGRNHVRSAIENARVKENYKYDDALFTGIL